MASWDYHLRQAEVASRLTLAESDPVKAAALHLLALEHFEKAEKAKVNNQAAHSLQFGASEWDGGEIVPSYGNSQ
jgi:hypothetical protein